MKMACIGASYLFIHGVVNDMALTGEFEDCEIAVVDLLEEPLGIVVESCRKITAAHSSTIRVSGTTDSIQYMLFHVPTCYKKIIRP